MANEIEFEKKKYPVISLDFSRISVEKFEFDLTQELMKGVGYEYGMKFSNISYSIVDVFRYLIQSLIFLNSLDGRDPGFVIIIDEYDKTVLDCLENLGLARKKSLNSFFQMVKSYAPIFSFITGPS